MQRKGNFSNQARKEGGVSDAGAVLKSGIGGQHFKKYIIQVAIG